MKKNIEQRLSTMEKRCSYKEVKIVTKYCPHTLYVGEAPPCVDCDHARHPMRACVRFITPGKREK